MSEDSFARQVFISEPAGSRLRTRWSNQIQNLASSRLDIPPSDLMTEAMERRTWRRITLALPSLPLSLLGVNNSLEPCANQPVDQRTPTVAQNNGIQVSNNASYQSSAPDETISDGGAFLSVEVTQTAGYPATIELSTSAVLHYCKRKVLSPYFRLLALLGWRPLIESSSDSSCCIKFLNIAYTLAVLVFILVGYLLQYAACFRRDGYLCYQQPAALVTAVTDPPYLSTNEKPSSSSPPSSADQKLSCEGNVIFLYIIPNLLHFSAYVYTFFIIRNSENEHLQTILEKVFLQSSMSHAWHLSQRKVMRRLRTFLLLGLCWLIISMAVQILHIVSEESINFTWIKSDTNSLKVVLICIMLIGIFWFDIICVAVVLSYCVHCQLLHSYMTNLCDRLRERTLQFQSFIKAIEDLRKILKYVNDVVATGMSLLLIIFACNTSTGLFNVFGGNISKEDTIFKTMSSVGSLVLWLSILSFPIIQAVKLTSSMNSIRKLAQEIRSRPFGYQETPLHELDSFLLYATSLSLKARIFRVPVTYAFILAFVTGFFYLVVFLGQVSVVRFIS